MKTPILVEGYTVEEILQFPREQIEALVLTGQPLVFRAGSAQILGEFSIRTETLVVALAQIEGGGEGVLPTVWVLCERFARDQQLKRIEWVVHAINCAKPNPKLRPFLEKRGFQIEDIPGHGQAYHFVKMLDDSPQILEDALRGEKESEAIGLIASLLILYVGLLFQGFKSQNLGVELLGFGDFDTMIPSPF